MALRTRSRLSRTLVSGRPTIVKIGMPNDDVDLDMDGAGLDAEDGGRSQGRKHAVDAARDTSTEVPACFQ